MATQVFKDDKHAWIEPERLSAYLAQGWSVESANPTAPTNLNTGVRSIEEVKESTPPPQSNNTIPPIARIGVGADPVVTKRKYTRRA